ncbi:hypothetical protein BDV06DRAFT_233824 [Aspergillus oleicola]
MSQGYTRASGKPGVVIAKSGFSATNLITPMMDALADGTPLVVFCCQPSTHEDFMRHGDFRDGDILSMSQPCTKWNVAVKCVSELPRRVSEAFEVATRGQPGPVLVKVPQSMVTEHSQHLHSKAHGTMINRADRPVLYVGQGILSTPEDPQLLQMLADKASIPATTSLLGLGAFDETDSKALQMLGLHGSGYANMAMQIADLIIALGARFDDRVTGSIPKFAPKAKVAASEGQGGIIHFDVSPKNVNKVVEATEAVIGDCAENLKPLIPLVDCVDRPCWTAQIASWKNEYPLSDSEGRRDSQPQAFLERLNDLIHPIKSRTIFTTGVGQHQMWVAQHIHWQYPRSPITSGGLCTMVYGLPAVIWAQVARPDALVINVDGDASLNMTLNELLTARRNNLPVKIIVLNNAEQGMVTHLQTIYYGNRLSNSHGTNPDFLLAARSMGPAFLEVMIAQNALSLPVVPSGCGLDEFITYSGEEM